MSSRRRRVSLLALALALAGSASAAGARARGTPEQVLDPPSAPLPQAAQAAAVGAAVHTKEIHSSLDYDLICDPNGEFRKRLGDKGERDGSCLRRWAVLVMDDDKKGELVREVEVGAVSSPGQAMTSKSAYQAVVCTDEGWKAGAGDSAPCDADVTSSAVIPSLAPSVHAQWRVEHVRPLKVRWDNDQVFKAAAPVTLLLSRQVLDRLEASKVALKGAEELVEQLVAEEQLFLNGVLSATYRKLPDGQKSKDVSGEPFPELPPSIAFKVRADYVAAAELMVDERSGFKLRAARAAVDKLKELGRAPTPQPAQVVEAHGLSREVAKLCAAVREAVKGLKRPDLAVRLNRVATDSLFRHLGLSKDGGAADPAVDEAQVLAAEDAPNAQ